MSEIISRSFWLICGRHFRNGLRIIAYYRSLRASLGFYFIFFFGFSCLVCSWCILWVKWLLFFVAVHVVCSDPFETLANPWYRCSYFCLLTTLLAFFLTLSDAASHLSFELWIRLSPFFCCINVGYTHQIGHECDKHIHTIFIHITNY